MLSICLKDGVRAVKVGDVRMLSLPGGCKASSPSYQHNDGVQSCRSSKLSSFRNRWRTPQLRSGSAAVTPEPAVDACGRGF
jgi:alpha-L-arabinofuranosidase